MGATDNTQRLGPSRVERRAAHRLWEVEVLAMFLFHLFGVCVCVWGTQTTTGTLTVSRTQTCRFSRMQGVPWDCRRLAPTKTYVPTVCDIFNRASCVLLPY